VVKLSELNIEDRFTFIKPWNGWSTDTVFVFHGRTDVFVYGPNAFDICVKGQEKDCSFIVENMEVNKC
jgi:hypothetical protein